MRDHPDRCGEHQLVDSIFGDPALLDVELFQFRSAKVLQPGVGDRGISQTQRSDVGQSLDVFETRIGNQCVIQGEDTKFGQSPEACKPGPRNSGVVQAQPLESPSVPTCSRPASVTWVLFRYNPSWSAEQDVWSPASVILVRAKSSHFSWLSPERCSRPASVIWVSWTPSLRAVSSRQGLPIPRPKCGFHPGTRLRLVARL